MKIASVIQRVAFGFISAAIFFLSALRPVQAGTNLTITCHNEGFCSISSNAAFFDETNLAPGDTRQQQMTIINQDNDSCNLQVHFTPKQALPDALTQRIFIATQDENQVVQGSMINGQAGNILTLNQLLTRPMTVLGSVSGKSSKTFSWYATLDPNAGAEIMGVKTIFDIELKAECLGNAKSSTTTETGTIAGATTSNESVCAATAPSQAPQIIGLETSPNTATLAWTAVPASTHYAIFFVRDDGVMYGAPNVGNVTTYTITNLSGGSTYTFQVMAVNGCAPGPQSSAIRSDIIGGPIITQAPSGSEGEILGIQNSEPDFSSENALPSFGQVAGVMEEVCSPYPILLPVIILIIQALLILLNYKIIKKSLNRQLISISITLLSCILFYILAKCDCGKALTAEALICQWYWLLAGLVTGILFVFFRTVSRNRS